MTPQTDKATARPWHKQNNAVHYNNDSAGFRQAGTICDMVGNSEKDHANAFTPLSLTRKSAEAIKLQTKGNK